MVNNVTDYKTTAAMLNSAHTKYNFLGTERQVGWGRGMVDNPDPREECEHLKLCFSNLANICLFIPVQGDLTLTPEMEICT